MNEHANIIRDLATVRRMVMNDNGRARYMVLLLRARWGWRRTMGVCSTRRGQVFAKHVFRPAGPAANQCTRCGVMAPARDHVRLRRVKELGDRMRWSTIERHANPFDGIVTKARDDMRERLFIIDDPAVDP